MKKQFKLIRILECIITIIVLMIVFWWIEYFIQAKVPNISFEQFQKFIMPYFNFADKLIVRFFPLFYLLRYWKTTSTDKSLIKKYLMGFILVISGIIIGLIVAYFTWTNYNAPSPFLPEYLKYQPWMIYWTPIFLTAVIIPIINYSKYLR